MAKNKPEASADLVPQINKNSSSLSKLQQQFNQQINRINQLKEELQQRKETTAQLQVRVQKELQPLLKQVIDLKVHIVRRLDETCDHSSLGKKEKEKLAEFIEDLANNLIERHGRVELVAIYDKYAPVSYAEAEEEGKKMEQDMFNGFFGEGMEADDLDDGEKMKERLEHNLEEERHAYKSRGPKKKTKAQQEKEAAMKAEMQNISKASRRIYTELVKQLHPDKEQNEQERAWKEEVIKEVTLAYSNNDFFELLRLQMKFLADKSKALDKVPEEQLKYYVHLLNDQVQELQMESAQLTDGPEAQLYNHFGGTAKTVEQRFRREKRGLREEIQQLQAELRNFADPEVVRMLIKALRFS